MKKYIYLLLSLLLMSCNFNMGQDSTEHIHDFNTWEYTLENHYKKCSCGEINNIEEHIFKEGEVVLEETKYNNGIIEYTCECGHKKQEIIDDITLPVDSKREEIYLITTSAGEDISNSVGISWHCQSSGSYLVYNKEGTNDFIKVLPTEEYWSIEESYTSDPYQNKRYVCTVNLENLDSNSKYFYKILSKDTISVEYSFKTADPSALEYSFLSFVDFQYSMNNTSLSLVQTFVNKNPNANLITCSGDIADEGYKEEAHRHLFDTNVFSKHILAFGAGDHEYWGTGSSPYKMLQRPYAYNKLFNNPKNGCVDYLNSSYYFKLNTSLFVFLDCGDSNASSSNVMFAKQAQWLDDVLTKENYDFIIVCMHKSLYGDPKIDSAVRKFAPIFLNIFDKHKVDLVISGHDHEYSRTKPLSDGLVSEDGTVYLDLGNSGNKTRPTGEDIKSSPLYDKYIDLSILNYALGIVGTVSNDQLIINVRNFGYSLIDEVVISKKDR